MSNLVVPSSSSCTDTLVTSTTEIMSHPTKTIGTSLSSQLEASLELMSEKDNSFSPSFKEGNDKQGSARLLINARKVQRETAEAINSLFVPFDSRQPIQPTVGTAVLYDQIGSSTIEAPQYWKGTTKKAKDRKLSSGADYKDRLSTKMSKKSGRQDRLNHLKKMY